MRNIIRIYQDGIISNLDVIARTKNAFNVSLNLMINPSISLKHQKKDFLSFVAKEQLNLLHWDDALINLYAYVNLTKRLIAISSPEKIYDFGIVASFGHLIPTNIINSFKISCLNIHPSLIPRWAGAAPLMHTILSGDRISGVTIMKVSPDRFDQGAILSQETFKLDRILNYNDLAEMTAIRGVKMLASLLVDFARFESSALPQNSYDVPHLKACKLSKKMNWINWSNETQMQVYRKFCAFASSLHGIRTIFDGKPLILKDVFIPSDSATISNLQPGHAKMDWKNNKSLLIQCSDFSPIGVTHLLHVQHGRTITAEQFFHGYIRHRKLISFDSYVL